MPGGWLVGLLACRGASDVEPGQAGVTFYADLQPLLAESCARCHGPGGLPPGDFTDPDVVSVWAEVMSYRIAAGEMPPPSADPACHPYKDVERYAIDPALEDVLAEWIALDRPLGEPSGPPPEILAPTTLSRRDAELFVTAPYAPTLVDGNDYRCFILDDSVDADTWIAGIEFLADQVGISHHAHLLVDPDGGSEAHVTDPETRSWSCEDLQSGPEYQMIHAWAPGGGAVEFSDMGIAVAKGSQLVLQMHYFGSTDSPADLPGYALKFEPRVARELSYVALGPTDFVIPAGDGRYEAGVDLAMPELSGGLAYDVFGVLPHMHALGSSYSFTATDVDGHEKCISRAEDYDFALQPTYWFDEPVTVQSTDTITIRCTWDNSAENPSQRFRPPIDVTYGEHTEQEMCHAMMYVGTRADPSAPNGR